MGFIASLCLVLVPAITTYGTLLSLGYYGAYGLLFPLSIGAICYKFNKARNHWRKDKYNDQYWKEVNGKRLE